MSEYVEVSKQYPNIAFADTAEKRNKEHSLLQIETANIIPSNYFEENVSKYKKIYTWNSKLYRQYKEKGYDVIKIPNFPLFDNYTTLDCFRTYEERLDGVSLICRAREKPNFDWDISFRRIDVFQQIQGIEKHAYGKVPYCGEHYKGVIGQEPKETWPSSFSKLDKLNEYKFNLCFENAFHEMWSWDYVTEKITDCFKAKTIPVYLGCFNIEERVPKELYIDYREMMNTEKLVKRLKGISKSEFEDMTEKAFEWEKETRLGNIEELKEILNND